MRRSGFVLCTERSGCSPFLESSRLCRCTSRVLVRATSEVRTAFGAAHAFGLEGHSGALNAYLPAVHKDRQSIAEASETIVWRRSCRVRDQEVPFRVMLHLRQGADSRGAVGPRRSVRHSRGPAQAHRPHPEIPLAAPGGRSCRSLAHGSGRYRSSRPAERRASPRRLKPHAPAGSPRPGGRRTDATTAPIAQASIPTRRDRTVGSCAFARRARARNEDAAVSVVQPVEPPAPEHGVRGFSKRATS